MNWDVLDFAVFIGLLAGVGAIYVLATRLQFGTSYRIATGLALAAAFILVWVNGAVGVIGDENNDANLMIFGVLIVGLLGAVLARFRPRGMARALLAMAFAQVLVALIALAGKLGAAGPAWPQDILILTAFFTALWVTSAMLYRRAARQ